MMVKSMNPCLCIKLRQVKVLLSNIWDVLLKSFSFKINIFLLLVLLNKSKAMNTQMVIFKIRVQQNLTEELHVLRCKIRCCLRSLNIQTIFQNLISSNIVSHNSYSKTNICYTFLQLIFSFPSYKLGKLYL